MINSSLSRPEVVTLCGSMRFFMLLLDVAAAETSAGKIVIAPFVTVTVTNQSTRAKVALDELHRRKIDMCDRVIVVTDETGYYGTSTAREIVYAETLGIPVETRKVSRLPLVLDEAAWLIHRELCESECPGFPDCPTPEQALRYRRAAHAVLAGGSPQPSSAG